MRSNSVLAYTAKPSAGAEAWRGIGRDVSPQRNHRSRCRSTLHKRRSGGGSGRSLLDGRCIPYFVRIGVIGDFLRHIPFTVLVNPGRVNQKLLQFVAE